MHLNSLLTLCKDSGTQNCSTSTYTQSVFTAELGTQERSRWSYSSSQSRFEAVLFNESQRLSRTSGPRHVFSTTQTITARVKRCLGRKVIHVNLLLIRVPFCKKYLCSYRRHLTAEIPTSHPFQVLFQFRSGNPLLLISSAWREPVTGGPRWAPDQRRSRTALEHEVIQATRCDDRPLRETSTSSQAIIWPR
jgi:hypothetical protein